VGIINADMTRTKLQVQRKWSITQVQNGKSGCDCSIQKRWIEEGWTCY